MRSVLEISNHLVDGKEGHHDQDERETDILIRKRHHILDSPTKLDEILFN